MKPPPWLAELHRQWQSARGGKLGASLQPYRRDWVKLMDALGISGVEEETAVREALTLHDKGCIQVKSYGVRRHLIQSIALPLKSEAWLRELFGGVDAAELQQQSLALVAEAEALAHGRYPQLWSRWCGELREAFTEGRGLSPVNWRQPAEVGKMLSLVRRLTETEWTAGISVRTVSKEVGLDSKDLEKCQGSVESALTCFFGNVTSLQSLGITGSASHVWLAGPLVVHFEDGSTVNHAASRGCYSVDHVDLKRVASITTTAQRFLTVENLKATFRDIAAANEDGATLIAASSFPTTAMRLVLEKLPAGLPHYHFGDTDPAGWHILLKLRELSPAVQPLHMHWRPGKGPSPLTAFDRDLLPKLLANPLLQDCRTEMETMMDRNDRGDFEQESFGMPRKNWPFY